MITEKEKIIKKLINSGNNKEESEKIVNKHFDYIQRNYSNESIAKKAEIIKSLGNEY